MYAISSRSLWPSNQDYYYYYYYFTLLRIFLSSIHRLFSTWVWVTASLLQFSELSSVFWPFLIMLSFGWPPLVFLCLIFQTLYEDFGTCNEHTNYKFCHCNVQFHKFFRFSGNVLVLIPLFAFFQFYPPLSRNGKIHYSACYFYCYY